VALAADTRTYISAAFAFVIKSANSYTQPAGATKWGIETNPVAAIPADPAGARIGDRHLSPSEFRAFWRWLEREDSNSAVAPALRLIMATGQRVTEILELTNTSYDRGERMLDWRKTKNGRQHSIPLPTQALSILDGLVVNRHGLFFPHGRRPDEPATIYSPPKVIYHYAEDTGAAPFTARDFRRTWKTLTGAAGLSKDIRDRLQNHARQDVSSRHYDRYEYLQEKRAAMATWSAYLDRILAGEFDKNAMKEAA
jgi:integrase